jgi:hypothetical protein
VIRIQGIPEVAAKLAATLKSPATRPGEHPSRRVEGK